LRRAHHITSSFDGGHAGLSSGAHSRDPLALPTLRLLRSLTHPEMNCGSLLDQNSFEVVDHVVEDARAGGRTGWFCRKT